MLHPLGALKIKGSEREAQIRKESNCIKAYITNISQIDQERIIYIMQRDTKQNKQIKKTEAMPKSSKC